jgi:hypothetical protein
MKLGAVTLILAVLSLLALLSAAPAGAADLAVFSSGAMELGAGSSPASSVRSATR